MFCQLSFAARRGLVAIALMLTLSELTIAWSQTADPQSTELDAPGMASELERLARVCDSLGLPDQALISRQWLPTRRDDQTTLFLPSGNTKYTSNSNAKIVKWSEYFLAARERHAEYWYNQATRMATQGDEVDAYRALWRALRENPQHAAAKKTLGPLASGLGTSVRQRRSTLAHAQFAWPAGTFSRVDLPHFLLTSRADSRQTEAFAKQLESFYVLWTQVFYPLWAAPGVISDKLQGGVINWEPRRQIRVVLLRDRQEYLQTLGATEENIGVSVGYYNPEARTSFFYPDASLQVTLYHELTHQLLAEASRIGALPEAGHASDFWILEGIAMYMESLWNGDHHWTLGGWESPRLQSARYRAVRENYWIPWEKFQSGSLNDWKKDPDIAKLYTHAAGLTHFLLDAPNQEKSASELPESRSAERREAFFRSLVAVYQGQSGAGELDSILGSAQAQQQHQKFLQVNNQDVLALSPQRQLTDLVLTASQLSSEAWSSLKNQKSLKWIDLSFSNSPPEHLDWLFGNSRLQRLSIEGTSVKSPSLVRIGELASLEELDLSNCPVDDAALNALAHHRKLTTLWLTKTQVTDSVLSILDTIPNLAFVDIQLTQISPSAWQQFLQTHPKVNRK